MVSFSCEECGDVLTKKKLDPHRNRCRGATFTCIDCMVHFPGVEYRSHTSCITEDQKYQGALYKPKRQKPNQNGAFANQDDMAHRAYVEDAAEEYEDYEVSDLFSGMPAAPMPPPAVPDDDANVNVFDYMLEATPTASRVNYPTQPIQPMHSMHSMQQTPTGLGGGRQLIRFESDANEVNDSGYMVDDGAMEQCGAAYETPAPKPHKQKSKDPERELKKDKKRKRLHIETSPALLDRGTDEVMMDAPPVLHSGLTGGLNRMMRPSQFPPSPDYSGGDAAEKSPTNSIKKKKKHTKSTTRPRRTDSLGSNLKALVSGTSKSKVSKQRRQSSERKEKKRRTHSHSSTEKSPKLIEFREKSGEGKPDESGTLVVYRPRSDLFLSLCNKGPKSDRGCSMNKALKRYHRERSSSGTNLSKGMEEKELWRSLRMRRNDRGEIVLFSLEDEE